VLAAWDPARPEGALVAPRYILVSLQPPNFEVQTPSLSAEFPASARFGCRRRPGMAASGLLIIA